MKCKNSVVFWALAQTVGQGVTWRHVKEPLRLLVHGSKDASSQKGVKDASISKWLKPNKAPVRSILKMRDRDVRKIFQAFGVEVGQEALLRVEKCATAADIQAAVNAIRAGARIGTLGLSHAQAVFCNPTPNSNWVSLLEHERTALDLFVASLRNKGLPLGVVWARGHSGVSGLLWRLTPGETGYNKVIHIRPSAQEANWSTLLNSACNKAGIEKFLTENASDVVARLRQENAILIVHNAHVFWTKFSDEASKRAVLRFVQVKVPGPDVVRTVFVLNDRLVPPAMSGAVHARRLPLVASLMARSEAGPAFQELLEDYAAALVAAGHNECAQKVPIESPGMKRLTDHIDRLVRMKGNEFKLPVSTLRFRAAAMANSSMPSEGDPTLGFSRLISPEIMKADPCLNLMADDIRSVLLHFVTDPRKEAALRLLSTGVYWFSKQMVLKLEANLKLGCSWDDLIDLTENNDIAFYHFETETRLTAPLALRAVVQDDWRRAKDPLRAQVHRAIADILEEAGRSEGKAPADLSAPKDEKGDRSGVVMAQEYPFKTPVKGRQVILYSEAIRHLSRAAETSPDAPDLIARATRLYWSLENGFERLFLQRNNASARDHALSRGGGRYHLKMEILHHLSEDGRGYEPHADGRALLKKLYQSEVGMVDLGLLRVPRAVRRLDGAFRSRRREVEPALWLNDGLHLAAAHILRLDMKAAHAVMQELSQHCIRGGEERLRTLQAAAANVSGYHSEARKIILADMNMRKNPPMQGDRALIAIDAFLAAPKNECQVSEMLRFASLLCSSNNTNDMRENHPHEVVRFDIREARCWIQCGHVEAANNSLSTVADTLKRNGGSPRLLHDFQIAAGECLLAEGWVEWALMGYLVPCMRRARDGDAKSYHAEAAIIAEKCFKVLKARKHAVGDNFPQVSAHLLNLEIPPEVQGEAFEAILSRSTGLLGEWHRLSGVRSSAQWAHLLGRTIRGSMPSEERDVFSGVDFSFLAGARSAEAPENMLSEAILLEYEKLIQDGVSYRQAAQESYKCLFPMYQ